MSAKLEIPEVRTSCRCWRDSRLKLRRGSWRGRRPGQSRRRRRSGGGSEGWRCRIGTEEWTRFWKKIGFFNCLSLDIYQSTKRNTIWSHCIFFNQHCFERSNNVIIGHIKLQSIKFKFNISVYLAKVRTNTMIIPIFPGLGHCKCSAMNRPM